MEPEKPTFDLDRAYGVQTPADSRALYRDWAQTYDETFAASHGWDCPRSVAQLIAEWTDRYGVSGPVLDVGCGTGVVGVELAATGYFPSIHGIDISPEMLDVAAQKQCYEALIAADVTVPLPFEAHTFAGIVSAGTFTHGHLGPAPIPELVRVGAPGAIYALGINRDHFVEHGFDRVLGELTEQGVITEPELPERPMFVGDGAGDHADIVAKIALFRRR